MKGVKCFPFAEASSSSLSVPEALHILQAVSRFFLGFLLGWGSGMLIPYRHQYIFKLVSCNNNFELYNQNVVVLFFFLAKSPLSSRMSPSKSPGLFLKTFFPHQAESRYTWLLYLTRATIVI